MQLQIKEDEMIKIISIMFLMFFMLYGAQNGWAHFGVIMPSDDIISAKDSKKITLQVKFMHPFEWQYMNMEKPVKFGVIIGDKNQDLLKDLKSKKTKGFTFWE